MGARFVRLGIAGFKSFADPTLIEILPGLTGIVGPNGCGKSNVTEALQWAMGEGNARSLRGGEMDDIIFAGAANRPRRNLAEVSLTLEDDDNGLPSPFAGLAELQVVRRIERGAGSAYRINGREVRARDVQTLFADLASGARSSGMVSQGRVSALVNARPEERRATLEEAAGITGLHARRTEAETRLRAAETNVARAEDRRVVLEQQLGSLIVQARQAEHYRTITTDAAAAEAALLAVQCARARAAVIDAAAVAEAARNTLQQAHVAKAKSEAEAQTILSTLPVLREAEASDRTALEVARVALASITAEVSRAEAAVLAAQQRQALLQKDLLHAEGVLRDAEHADARLVAEAAGIEADAADHPALLQQALADAHCAAEALVHADEAARQAATEATEAAARSAALKRLLDDAQARSTRAEAAHRTVDVARRNAMAAAIDPARLKAVEAAQQASEDAAAQARAAQLAAEAERIRVTPIATAARDAHAKAEATRHKIAAQTAALAEVLAVRDADRWPPMIDSLTVPPGLEAALGASIGEELAAAANPHAPRHWRQLPPLPATRVAGEVLNALVQAPELLDRALSAIGLVESDADGDAAQSGLLPGQTLVSKSGAIWRWDGYTVRAGTPTPATIRLQQRNRLSALQAQLAVAERDMSGALGERQAAEQAERAAANADQNTRAARREAELAAERSREGVASLQRQSDAAASRLAVLDEQWHQVTAELDEATKALDVARREHVALIDAAALRAAAEQSRATVTAARAKDAAASRALDAIRREHLARSTRAVAIIREREDRAMRAAELVGRVSDLKARAIEADNEERRLTTLPSKAAHTAAMQHQVLSDIERRYKLNTVEREAAERAAALALATSRAANDALSLAREALVRAESAHDAASQMAAAVNARALERESALPTSPVPTDFSAAAEDKARARLGRLIRERDAIGPVNLRAEFEASAIGNEIDTIAKERDELDAAIAKLRGSIGHLNREGRERLSAIFQQVDQHFQGLFGRMFGGGRAHLAMVGSDDPLQAGLEIYAQPPGKKLSALSLLSGGEQALTALSLICAIFLCNPAPLCVLDEVDAPLDDANVQRFCSLLIDMVQETGTRFLVVTHHQVTMSQMDRLYGVTMQERGVSRLLSVNLSDAMGMLEPVTTE